MQKRLPTAADHAAEAAKMDLHLQTSPLYRPSGYVDSEGEFVRT